MNSLVLQNFLKSNLVVKKLKREKEYS